jgi:hypothetical protein
MIKDIIILLELFALMNIQEVIKDIIILLELFALMNEPDNQIEHEYRVQ